MKLSQWLVVIFILTPVAIYLYLRDKLRGVEE